MRSFAVDFVGQTEHFQPDALRATPDTPYVHDVAGHVGAEHQDIVLDNETLSDPELRRRVVRRATTCRAGLGDMYASLYLLCQAIRERSTVALSGESADELFGGYQQFHDPAVQRAHAFPWLAMDETLACSPDEILAPGVAGRAGPAGYRRDGVRERDRRGRAPRTGEQRLERRMRISSYLHLTRFVRYLLDRKDRMSMAVGLEVRVPFCDHRLVEYVYNAPWAMKTYDGREKSLLRGAARDVLPRSVDGARQEPVSVDAGSALRQRRCSARRASARYRRGVLDLVDRAWLDRATRPAAEVSAGDRRGWSGRSTSPRGWTCTSPRLVL